MELELLLPTLPIALLLFLAFLLWLWTGYVRSSIAANSLPLIPSSAKIRITEMNEMHAFGELDFDIHHGDSNDRRVERTQQGRNGINRNENSNEPIDSVPVFIKRYQGKWPLADMKSGMANEIEVLSRLSDLKVSRALRPIGLHVLSTWSEFDKSLGRQRLFHFNPQNSGDRPRLWLHPSRSSFFFPSGEFDSERVFWKQRRLKSNTSSSSSSSSSLSSSSSSDNNNKNGFGNNCDNKYRYDKDDGDERININGQGLNDGGENGKGDDDDAAGELNVSTISINIETKDLQPDPDRDDEASATLADDDDAPLFSGIVTHGGSSGRHHHHLEVPTWDWDRHVGELPSDVPPANCVIFPRFDADLSTDIDRYRLPPERTDATIAAFDALMMRRVHLAAEICLAVADLHDAGIAHLDIKPSNILIRYDSNDHSSSNSNAGGRSIFNGSSRISEGEAAPRISTIALSDFDVARVFPGTFIENFPFSHAAEFRRADSFAPPELTKESKKHGLCGRSAAMAADCFSLGRIIECLLLPIASGCPEAIGWDPTPLVHALSERDPADRMSARVAVVRMASIMERV